MRTGFAAEKFRRVCRGALEYLHWREPGFFHQLKFTEKGGTVNCAVPSGTSADGDRHACVFELLQVRQSDIVRLLNSIEHGFRISQRVLDSLRQFVLRNLCHVE